ncbi:MAG: hypothetical protein U0168_13505 [Nannocystaceae bacterium]
MDGGDIITVCEYAEFNHSYLAIGTTQELILAPSILIAGYAFIGASARVHARNIIGQRSGRRSSIMNSATM